MKRKFLKKLVIFTLVGVILGSSIMSNYKQAERVEASVTATFGVGALLAMGVMATCGVVYTNNVANKNLFASNLAEIEYDIAEIWDTQVIQFANANGYDPDEEPDDEDGDGLPDLQNNPVKWAQMKKMYEEKKWSGLKTAIGGVATGIGVVLGNIATSLKEKLETVRSAPLETTAPTTFDVRLWQEWYNTKTIDNAPYFFWRASSPNIFYTFVCNENYTSIPYLRYKESVNGNELYSRTGPIYYFHILNDKVYREHLSYQSFQTIISNMNDISEEVIFTNMKIVDYYDSSIVYRDAYTDNLVQENVTTSSNYLPEAPTIYNYFSVPTNAQANALANELAQVQEDTAKLQETVDTFIGSITSVETEPTPEPDVGGDTDNGDSGSDEDNSKEEEEVTDKNKFTADLSKFFPFCIPFDLINAIRIFNAEPETPRIEIPIHFGIVDKDYTFVFDLEDFNGVATICRSTFTILYIVGLIMITRNLIRG